MQIISNLINFFQLLVRKEIIPMEIMQNEKWYAISKCLIKNGNFELNYVMSFPFLSVVQLRKAFECF